jgi:hypothetical protein
MRRCFALGIIALALLFSQNLFAASMEFKGYTFDARVIKASGKQYREFVENRQNSLKVRPNEEYSIVVRNPLPVRVAVAVTIDGLNSIDGKRTTTRNAQKWMIAPNSSLTISGWQTSKETLRKFLFTEQSATFAQWREDKDGKRFTKNLGVIGVAWFWNSNELELALHPPQPQPFVEEESRSANFSDQAASKSAGAPSAAPSRRAEAKAGTGMGRQEHNYVTEVVFDANTGMYAVKDVLKIFYEFAQDPTEPQPFVDDDEDEGRFTPDMHK